MKWLKFFVPIVTLFTLLWLTDTSFAQCAMCKATAEQSPGLAMKLNAGILYLLLMPYLIVGTIASLVYRAYRQQRGEEGNGRNEEIKKRG